MFRIKISKDYTAIGANNSNFCLEKGCEYAVYAVNKNANSTQFMIYDMSEWRWIPSKICKPI